MSGQVYSFLLRILTLTIIASVMIYLTDVKATIIVVLALLIFALPGTVIMSYVSGSTASVYEFDHILFLGSVLGVVVSSMVAVVVSYAFGFESSYIIIGIVCTCVLLLILAQRSKQLQASLVNIPKREGIILCAFLIITALALVIPYRSFGIPTRSGVAFSGLHKTDLLHHMSTAIELTKGVPPENPYFAGERLHYYWLSHVFPAFSYSLSGYSVEPRDISVLTGVIYSALFIGVLYLTIRIFFKEPLILMLLMTLAIGAYGYNDIFVVANKIVEYLPESPGKEYVWSRMFVDDWGQEYTGYSHGWFRSFMVEPQVSLVLSVFLMFIFLSRVYGMWPRQKHIGLLQGLLVSSALAIDSFLAAVFALSYFILTIYELLAKGVKGRIVKPAMTVGLMTAATILVMVWLEMVNLGFQSLVLEPYTTMLVLAPLYFIVDYGPSVGFGAAGMLLQFRDRKGLDTHYSFLAVLAAVSLAFMFFFRYPDVGTQIFRKGGITLRIALVVFAGVGLQHYFVKCARAQWVSWGTLGVLIILALPTLGVDIYQISRVEGAEGGAYEISSSAMRAYSWIRETLPGDAVVQDMPTGISGIVALAERRTALGDWEHAKGYQIGTEKVGIRHNDIYRTLFQGKEIEKAIGVMKKYGIEYIYVDPEAKSRMHSAAIQKFEQSPQYFRRIYMGEGIAIYEFLLGGGKAASFR